MTHSIHCVVSYRVRGREVTTDLPPMWRCGDCPLIIVGDRPDDITEHQAEHQEAEK